jgi:hypothetical protein
LGSSPQSSTKNTKVDEEASGSVSDERRRYETGNESRGANYTTCDDFFSI